jgi:hypothetical protein
MQPGDIPGGASTAGRDYQAPAEQGAPAENRKVLLGQ